MDWAFAQYTGNDILRSGQRSARVGEVRTGGGLLKSQTLPHQFSRFFFAATHPLATETVRPGGPGGGGSIVALPSAWTSGQGVLPERLHYALPALVPFEMDVDAACAHLICRRRHLRLDPLDRSRAHSELCGDLQDALVPPSRVPS